jgi:hypothetical protein
MSRGVVVMAVLALVASLSGCGTCCYCYCGDVPTNQLVASDEPRPEIAPQLKPVVVVARY